MITPSVKVGLRHSHGGSPTVKREDLCSSSGHEMAGRDHTGVPCGLFISAGWRGAPHSRGRDLGSVNDCRDLFTKIPVHPCCAKRSASQLQGGGAVPCDDFNCSTLVRSGGLRRNLHSVMPQRGSEPLQAGQGQLLAERAKHWPLCCTDYRNTLQTLGLFVSRWASLITLDELAGACWRAL